MVNSCNAEKKREYDSVHKKKRFNDWNADWDMRANKESKGVHRIILVRHGQYDTKSNEDHQRVLTVKGQEQAMKTGERLANLIASNQMYPIKYVYYSTMQRATETAFLMMPYLLEQNQNPNNIILKEHNIKPCSMIREGAVITPLPTIDNWKPSQESFFKDNLRVEAAFMNHVHRPKRINEQEEQNSNSNCNGDKSEKKSNENEPYSTLLVCHGNVIRYFILRALQMDPRAWHRLAVYNASITVIDVYSDGQVSIKAMGDTGHFDPDLITYA